jgi:arginase
MATHKPTHKPTPNIPVVAYASSLAGNISGAELGPMFLRKSSYFQKHKNSFHWKFSTQADATKVSARDITAMDTVSANCTELAQYLNQHPSNTPYLVLGGDHSMAIGTWSGLASPHQGDIGLLWIDAHFDSHTPETTHSHFIHGMPVAALLGHGDPKLTHIIGPYPKIKARNLCMIGIRDYEPEEKKLLDRLGVRYYDMAMITKQGLTQIMQQAMDYISEHTQHFGISIDLDAIDPSQAPAVSVPVPHGLDGATLVQCLKQLRTHPHFEHLLALEIAEFNPSKDINGQTETLIQNIIEACLFPS